MTGLKGVARVGGLLLLSLALSLAGCSAVGVGGPPRAVPVAVASDFSVCVIHPAACSWVPQARALDRPVSVTLRPSLQQDLAQ